MGLCGQGHGMEMLMKPKEMLTKQINSLGVAFFSANTIGQQRTAAARKKHIKERRRRRQREGYIGRERGREVLKIRRRKLLNSCPPLIAKNLAQSVCLEIRAQNKCPKVEQRKSPLPPRSPLFSSHSPLLSPSLFRALSRRTLDRFNSGLTASLLVNRAT